MTNKKQFPLFPDTNGGMGKLEVAFWNFHNAHPEVYRYLVKFAYEWRETKGDGIHLGIKALFERVRWEIGLHDSQDSPKLNNNHTAFYARLIMDCNKNLKNIFVLRRQRIASTIGPVNDKLPDVKHIA